MPTLTKGRRKAAKPTRPHRDVAPLPPLQVAVFRAGKRLKDVEITDPRVYSIRHWNEMNMPCEALYALAITDQVARRLSFASRPCTHSNRARKGLASEAAVVSLQPKRAQEGRGVFARSPPESSLTSRCARG